MFRKLSTLKSLVNREPVELKITFGDTEKISSVTKKRLAVPCKKITGIVTGSVK